MNMEQPPSESRMSARSIVHLMYHEIELPGRPMCQSDVGYVRYIVSEADFRAQLQWLQSAGWRGMSVPEALKYPDGLGVAITFDDGCETDLLTTAPLFKAAAFNATFYITVGFLGKPGYLSTDELRSLSDWGFDIGCHSMTHAYLSDLDLKGLRRELIEPKLRLEQITGQAVEHFSCPGGRWDRRVAELAREAGYKSVATSRNFANSIRTDPFSLGRVAVMRDTPLSVFQRICRGGGLWQRQVADLTRATAKKLMGNTGYDALRGLLLSRGKTANG